MKKPPVNKTLRKATVKRVSKETSISATLLIEGTGKYDISTGIRFLDHMLELVTKHGGFDLTLKATGDLDIDQHHTVEDVGIVLGEVFKKALGKKDGDIGKDDLARGEKELEKVTSDHVAKIDELLKHKEAELLEV